MRHQSSEGITFEIHPLADGETHSAIILDTREGQIAFKKIKFDIPSIQRMVDQEMRRCVLELLGEMMFEERIKKELDRRIEIACKAMEGSISGALAIELQSRIKARAIQMVTELPVKVSIQVDGIGGDGHGDA
jgi:DNA integrity scanning protein DisA with diadenylate cyclase activity